MDRPDQQAENATEQPIAQQLNLIYLAGKQSPVSQEEEVIRKRASELIDEKIFGPRKKQFGPEPVCSTDRAAYWMERLEFGSTGDLRQNDGYLTHLELADAMKDKELTAMAVKLLTRYSSISALCNEGIERRITTRDIERLFKIDEKLSNLFRELANSHAALSELERKSVVKLVTALVENNIDELTKEASSLLKQPGSSAVFTALKDVLAGSSVIVTFDSNSLKLQHRSGWFGTPARLTISGSGVTDYNDVAGMGRMKRFMSSSENLGVLCRDALMHFNSK